MISTRVWLGVHLRTADTSAVAMGHHVAGWALDRYFQPLDDDR